MFALPTQPGNLTNYAYGPWGPQLLSQLQPMPMPSSGGQQQQQQSNQSASSLQQMSQIMQQFQKFGQQQPRAANGQFMSQQDAAAQMLGSDQTAPVLGMDNSYMGYGADQGSPSWGMDPSGGGGAGFMGYGA